MPTHFTVFKILSHDISVGQYAHLLITKFYCQLQCHFSYHFFCTGYEIGPNEEFRNKLEIRQE